MVDTSYYTKIQDEQSAPMGDELGYTYQKLTENELSRFGLSFERQFLLQLSQREWTADVFERHVAAILLGGMVAKNQMEAQIDGEVPGSGKVAGPIIIDPSFVGIGSAWEAPSPFTTGSAQNWIHSGTTFLGGTAGNAIRVGRNAVHVILGVASYHPSPKLEAIQNTLDGKLKPKQILRWGQQNNPQNALFKLKEFDQEIILQRNSTLKSQLFASASLGATVADTPYLFGCSFIAEAQLRILDPSTLAGTTNDLILTT